MTRKTISTRKPKRSSDSLTMVFFEEGKRVNSARLMIDLCVRSRSPTNYRKLPRQN
jgi:hypothetical protein